MSTEPKWPSEADAREALEKAGHGEGDIPTFCRTSILVTIDMCRAAWLAANDDPSADLPGTVRTAPDGRVTIRVGRRAFNADFPWTAINEDGIPEGLQHHHVAGWTRGTPIPGTPAARAQQ